MPHKDVTRYFEELKGSMLLEKYKPILEKVKIETNKMGDLNFVPLDMRNVIYSLYFWKYLVIENYSNIKFIKLSDFELGDLTHQIIPHLILTLKDIYENDTKKFDYFCKSFKLILLYGFSIHLSYLSMKTKSFFKTPRFPVLNGISMSIDKQILPDVSIAASDVISEKKLDVENDKDIIPYGSTLQINKGFKSNNNKERYNNIFDKLIDNPIEIFELAYDRGLVLTDKGEKIKIGCNFSGEKKRSTY